MLVEDPKEALIALFKHPDDVITDSSYIKVYKQIKYKKQRDEKSVGETKAETHLGSFRIYDLVEQIPSMSKGNNRITITGKLLSDIWKKEKNIKKNNDFKKVLADILLNNSYKGSLYKKFLKFMEKERTVDEVKRKYKWRTAYTLLAWCELVDLLAPVGNGRFKKIFVKKKLKKIPLEKFWKGVCSAYEEIRKIDYDKKRIIVDFADMRQRVTYNLHLSESKEFDIHFTKLMKSKCREFINLHGGVVGDFDPVKNFEFKGRLYPNLSLITED